MTAATTTPAPAGRGDWVWHLKPPAMPSPAAHLTQPSSAPLELQFLPPSASAVASAAGPSSSVAGASAATLHLPSSHASSPWNVDPGRLQKLMMGSVPASTASSHAASCNSNGNRAAFADVGAFFGPGINKPLPSGWERCLDLKSGEVFIKKCEALSNSVAGGISKQAMVQSSSMGEGRQKIMPLIEIPDKVMAIDSKRADWISDWMVAKPSSTMEHPLRKGSGAFTGRNTATVIKQENIDSSDGPPLSLDLDLRLTSDSRSRLACEALDVPSWRSRHSVSAPSAPVGQDSYYNQTQSWKLQSAAQDTGRLTSIQEMVSETTMATAVCSKCLMYVLLKKTNPTCPRCFNPIILDCCGKGSSVKKRARLELSPDDFSLSTDSSR